MDDATIIAIAGILGTLLAGLGGTLLNHYFSERAAKAALRRQFKERRLLPLMALVTDVIGLVQKLELSEDKAQSEAIIQELQAVKRNKAWEAAFSAVGIDERIDHKRSEFTRLATEFERVKGDAFQNENSADAKRAHELMIDLSAEAGLLLNLCYEVLEER